MKDLVKDSYSGGGYGTLRFSREDSIAPLVSFVDNLAEVGSLVESLDGAWQASLL